MATFTPGGDAASWLAQEWSPGISIAAYEETRILPCFRDVGMIPYKYNMPQHAAVTAVQLGESVSGAALSATSNTEVLKTITCATYYVMLEVNHNTLSRMASDPKDELRKSVEMAVGAKMDVVAGLTFVDLTNATTAGTAFSENDIKYAAYYMAKEGKGWYMPGKTSGKLVISPAALHGALGITNLIQFQMTGQAAEKGAYISGMVARGYGFDIIETAAVPVTGSDDSCAAFIGGKTFSWGKSKKATVMVQEFELVDRIIAWCDMGAVCEWPLAGLEILALGTAPAVP